MDRWQYKFSLRHFIPLRLLKYFSEMHYVTIEALLLITLYHFFEHGFPLNILIAVIASIVSDIALQVSLFKKPIRLPLPAVISGLIIGLVSPFSTSIITVVIPSIIAVFSKFFISFNKIHFFNPAVFGVVASMFLFSSIASHVSPEGSAHMAGMGEANIGGFSVNLIFVPFLVYASYAARRLTVSIPNLITSGLLYYFTGLAHLDILNSFSILNFLNTLPYFFSFIIASEPKTSPVSKNLQIIFGVGIAILPFLPLFFGKSYDHVGALVSLLVGNLIYAVFRNSLMISK